MLLLSVVTWGNNAWTDGHRTGSNPICGRRSPTFSRDGTSFWSHKNGPCYAHTNTWSFGISPHVWNIRILCPRGNSVGTLACGGIQPSPVQKYRSRHTRGDGSGRPSGDGGIHRPRYSGDTRLLSNNNSGSAMQRPLPWIQTYCARTPVRNCQLQQQWSGNRGSWRYAFLSVVQSQYISKSEIPRSIWGDRRALGAGFHRCQPSYRHVPVVLREWNLAASTHRTATLSSRATCRLHKN
jgi:hypothetical protein